MKAFVSWLVALVLGYGALGGGYHHYLSSNPKKLAVVVDSSYAMKEVWGEVPALLDGIDDEKYASYALLTEKRLIHGWKDSLQWSNPAAYAPRDFSRIVSNPILGEAQVVFFVTNANAATLESLPDWVVVRGAGW